jgi:O-antigen ligase
MSRPFNRSITAGRNSDDDRVWSWALATRVASVLMLGVMVARATTTDVVREAWAATPGSPAGGSGAGPCTSLVLDLLSAVPALLVLARRAFDRDYRLVARRSHWLLLGLAGWMAASAGWADDRFAAVVSAGSFIGGACLLWAASQLVRSWDRLRVVAAVALGLLLALAAHTILYRFNDQAELKHFWEENRQQFLHDRGWAEGSFAAVQFEHKITSGEQAAFFTSANTLAAVGVLLLFASLGLGVQRALDDRDPRWLALSAVGVAAGCWVLWVGQSKTSIVTPVIGVTLLGAWWVRRQWLAGRFDTSPPGFDVIPTVPSTAAKPVAPAPAPTGATDTDRGAVATFAVAVAGLTVVAVGVVGWGVAHHGLFPGHFSNSLDFRWKYWTASAGVFGERPVLGVGWANFGQHYLAHRVPDAAEEIQDPHNFLVRFATELGTVGLLLAVGWLLGLAWELTRAAADPASPAEPTTPARVSVIGWVAGVGFVIGAVAAVDFSGNPVDVLVLLMRPALLLLAVALGGIAGAMRSPHERAVDGRPGPWVFAGIVVALGLFLVHNLIDFGWFEPGAMAAFMVLAGSALGVTPTVERQPAPRAAAVGGLALATAAWAAVAVLVAVPIGLADQLAGAADELIRTARPNQPADVAAAYRRASAGYAAAADLVPYDAQLWSRAAETAYLGGDRRDAQQWVSRAIDTDPRLIQARLLDGRLRSTTGDGTGLRAAYDAAVRLDPDDVPIHLEYADALDHLGDHRAAAAQYRAALAANDALPKGEPRRLSADDVATYRSRAGL